MENQFKTIIEPFRIKTVEPIGITTREERKTLLKEAGLNIFNLKSESVLIDLLTDSGTSAMSTEQWAGVMRGDESYAGSPSFFRFEESLKKVTGFDHIIPTHQGRASERIMFQTLCKEGSLVVSNMLFDTTRSNAEAVGCITRDLPCEELLNPELEAPFKGNINLSKLEETLKNEEVSVVVMTVTNNSGGGQPASMENVRACSELCRKHKVPLALDACRFAENAWFIKTREEAYSEKSTLEIAQEMFALCDLTSISAKKDGMGNIGGVLALNNSEWAQQCKNNLILTEGFPTYGGLSGRDLEAIAVGVWEALDEDYLQYRIQSTAFVGRGLQKAGIPIVTPPGGHAVYIDAKQFMSHIPVSQFPGQALSSAIYEYAGIRCCEIGSVMFGREKEDGSEEPHIQELVRLAIPRRTYTQSHMEYLVEAFDSFKSDEREKTRGVKFTYKPKVLRHFTARFDWV